MSPAGPSAPLAAQARRVAAEMLVRGVEPALQGLLDGARRLADERIAPEVMQRRQRALHELIAPLPQLRQLLVAGLERSPFAPSRPGSLGLAGVGIGQLQLVDDDTIDLEILASRLALALGDGAGSELGDLQARLAGLGDRPPTESEDLLRPAVLARRILEAWRQAGLALAHWRTLQAVLHEHFGLMLAEAVHESNRWLIERGVRPEIDLRPMIRRSGGGSGSLGPASGLGGGGVASSAGPAAAPPPGWGLPPRPAPAARTGPGAGPAAPGEALLDRFRAAVAGGGGGGGGVGGSAAYASSGMQPSATLHAAIAEAQRTLRLNLDSSSRAAASSTLLVEDLQLRKLALKQAAGSQAERATIEIVALLFQSILSEERIPASLRVWFARLQMPVLRVALAEPDFFASSDHPARRLIDRMGACVMGFDAGGGTPGGGEALHREIKRVTQVVEAYPDTGSRVFQTVLTEFERFLEHYFRSENEASRKGVSLAQQIEQRETLAIQYTIELRKMLNEVPVPAGVRDFLFHVWADVLAMSALKSGRDSEATRLLRHAASDLVWSASAKLSREDRAEVIRRLPPLLKTLREGMGLAGVPPHAQDEHVRGLNGALSEAFAARTAPISAERLEELTRQLDALEALSPDSVRLELDASVVVDLSGYSSEELQIVTEGGSTPTPAMLDWAAELQVGGWYRLDCGGRRDTVQLAWQGMHRRLTLFVSAEGLGWLFQQQRLAAYLQAGLLVPAQDEALTVKATRDALERIDRDPGRLR